ncbi:MAG TPA: TonB-dependent receptor [Saprospiraceae bacterium]|nr:TonB-dependent receptor [Saprospiraceae bacterium]
MRQLFIFIVIHLTLASVSISQSLITGEIKNTEGFPLAGATVQIKGTNINTAADNTGQFQITAKSSFPFTLEVRFLGYVSQEIQIDKIPYEPLRIILADDNELFEIVITSRRRLETAQEVPIPISVVRSNVIEDAGAFNVNRVKELIPSVQLYSSNPRNTGLNIRGLGSTYGLTNDGIEPGVGFYVDGVFYARPAATSLDFIDVEQIEVLRGPQGTLFGKNTTAGAFNVITRKPAFTPGANFEVSFGNYGYIQAKGSLTGPLTKKIAGRLSFSGTQRDGVLENVVTGKSVNDINNLGIRGQLMYTPSEKTTIILAADATRQRPDGYAQVFAGVAPTQRAPYRQFEQIISDLEYTLPTRNPFDRKIDHDTPSKSGNDLGGVSANIDIKLGPGTLTSTTALRYWKWDPSTDRDFTGLPVLTKSQATSKQHQWSQEIRYAGTFSSHLSGVIGVYAFGQEIKSDPVQIEEAGSAQWRFSQSSTSLLWQTPGLFDGYGIKTRSSLKTFSGALFGQVDWEIINRLHILPGIRFNYDKKDVDYDRQTYGGLDTADPALIALKNAVYSNQSFKVNTDDDNFSGQLTLAYKASKRFNTFATYSTNFKSVGVNLGGLPTANGAILLDLAVIKPEEVHHYELGVKTMPTPGSTLNLTLYNTDIKNFQTQVQTAELGVNRGYLANAEKVQVRGIELEANFKIKQFLSLNGGFAYTEGIYVSFLNAPVPLEETGGASAFKDISGSVLPGISKWAGSLGAELQTKGSFLGQSGSFYVAFDTYYRSSFSSSPSPSAYLVIDGYALLNSRIGFKSSKGTSIFLWTRNLLDQDYFEQLLPAAGNAGQYAGVLGDPRTFGVTLRQAF